MLRLKSLIFVIFIAKVGFAQNLTDTESPKYSHTFVLEPVNVDDISLQEVLMMSLKDFISPDFDFDIRDESISKTTEDGAIITCNFSDEKNVPKVGCVFTWEDSNPDPISTTMIDFAKQSKDDSLKGLQEFIGNALSAWVVVLTYNGIDPTQVVDFDASSAMGGDAWMFKFPSMDVTIDGVGSDTVGIKIEKKSL